MDWINKYLNEQEVPFNATKIIDYPGFRQSTKYSCGVSETQSALIYCFGSKYDAPETELFKKLHTTESGGTDPESIVSFLKSKGTKVEMKTLTQDDLKECIDSEQPVIMCLQAWGKQKEYNDIYKEGHYITAIGYNDKGFIFEDPSISARYGFIPYSELDNRWHDVDKDGKKYDHLGIIIKCHKKYNPSNMEVIEGKQMSKLDGYLNQLHEGWFDKTVCKNAKEALADNNKILQRYLRDYKNCLKAGYKNRCEKLKQNAEKYKNVVNGNKEKIKKSCKSNVNEAGFETKPKGWNRKSVKKWANTLAKEEVNAATKKGFFDKCVKKMQGKVKNPEGLCAAAKDEAHGSTYWRGKDKSSKEVKKDVRAHQNVKEGFEMIDDFLQALNTDNRSQAKEWRGANIPYGDDSNRPNLIRQCMTLEGDRQKINCLRKLRDQAAMNPQYQTRLDRFVDAITGYYEPTTEEGTIPGNEFKRGNVGKDL